MSRKVGGELIVSDLMVELGGAGILQGLSTRVPAGSLCALLGPNGSGKSTFIRALLGLVDYSGRLELDGQSLSSLGPTGLARKIALVPQDTSASFGFTVRQTLEMGRMPHRGIFGSLGARGRELVDEALCLCGLEKLAHRDICSLSGGERQRVFIARAMVQEPEFLIMDEPTSNLDVAMAVRIMEVIKTLNRDRGVTVLSVFHDLGLAAAYCDHAICLKQGRLLCQGESSQVMNSLNLSRLFGTDILVRGGGSIGLPGFAVVPLGKINPGPGLETARVHIIPGGGSAGPFMMALRGAALTMTCGPVSQGDADCFMAADLELPRIEMEPFVAIGQEQFANQEKMISSADLLLLPPIPVGQMNLASLEACLAGLEQGKPLWLCVDPPFESRNFAGPRAQELHERIMAHPGTRSFSGMGEFLSLLTQGRDA